MKLLIALTLVVASAGALGIDRKPIREVEVSRLTNEAQAMQNDSRKLDFVWWIPQEFWQAALYQNPSVTREQADDVLRKLGNYSVMAVVQADISPFGAFQFFDRAAVSSGLLVEHVAGDGVVSQLAADPEISQDVDLILAQMRPVLAAAMGNLGDNLHFFAFSDVDERGHRIASPYERGLVRTQLSPRDGAPASELEIELPLDALMVPRTCPNGKPAHVSWNYCPWSGSKL